MLPSVEELLALDAITLREHTELPGDVFDVEQHRERLQKALKNSEICSAWRESQLVAYAMLRPESEVCWFVGAFCTHPQYRTPAVLSELIAKIARLASARGIVELKSHVYKTNRLSIAFHRKLGFWITQENEKAVEFFVSVSDLSGRPAVRRATRMGQP